MVVAAGREGREVRGAGAGAGAAGMEYASSDALVVGVLYLQLGKNSSR